MIWNPPPLGVGAGGSATADVILLVLDIICLQLFEGIAAIVNGRRARPPIRNLIHVVESS
jgi:hypothetical protein